MSGYARFQTLSMNKCGEARTRLCKAFSLRRREAVFRCFPIPPPITLPATPNAADLAAIEDIQLTPPAVKAQVLALNNNPLQIYNWLRNNISFIPSYGSIQGSELTLQNKRGNAFDIASLLIARGDSSNPKESIVAGRTQ